MPRTGIQLCYPFEEKRLAKWEPPYIVQPKLDGIRCRAVPVGNEYMLLSSEENTIFSVPHILKALKSYAHTQFEFDGELYCHGMNFERICSMVNRTKNLHPEHEMMEFHVFDIVADRIQSKRIGDVVETIPYGRKPIRRVPFKLAYSLKDIMKIYDEYLSQDYEGIIVRHMYASYVRKRSTAVMKFKPKKEDVYEITGYNEEIDKAGNPKDRLGAIVCKGGCEGISFAAGSGFTDKQREELWETRESLIGKKVRVQYQHTTSGGVPRFPVFKEVIS